MRAHNTELERGNDYIDIAKPELAIGDSTISAPIAHALAKAVPTEKKRAKKAKDEQTEKADASRRALAEIE
jgi:hypothetical protein